MTTAAIIQARMGSSRLPGKVLMTLGSATVLSHVVRRVAAAPGVDVVCVATVDSPQEDVVADEAGRAGAVVFRGHETDVLERYRGAANMLGADTVLRVTSDCPLIDPEVCGLVLRQHRETGCGYTSNNLVRSWPHGLDCEVMRYDLLVRAATEARAQEEREHVTPWLRTNPGVKRCNVACPRAGLASMRWTLDYPEDLAFFRGVWALLPNAGTAGWQEIADAVLAQHDVAALNAARIVH